MKINLLLSANQNKEISANEIFIRLIVNHSQMLRAKSGIYAETPKIGLIQKIEIKKIYMKRLIMTLCFIAAAVALTAQQWNIAIEHNEINACLTDGCCTTNNETVFVGYWDSEAYCVKVDKNGNSTEKHFPIEGGTSTFLNIISLEDGNCFLTGVSKTSNNEYLWILVIDDELNIVKEQFYEKEEGYSVDDSEFHNAKAVVDDDGTIVVCVGVRIPFIYPETYRIRGIFMRFNSDCERLTSVFIEPEAYNYLFYSSNFLTSCILNVPDNHDILIISRGQGNCPSVLRFDHDFNLLTHHVIHEQKLDQLGHEAISDYWIDNDNLLVVAEVTDPDIHNKEFIVFGRTSINSGYIYEDTWINKTDTLNYNIENHSMCAVNDTTIYLISRARIGSWLGPVAMEIYLVTKDLEILGSRYFYDETWYWPKTAIATKDDGIVAISYSPKERTYIKKLLREDFNPIPCSISEVPIERLKATAFPNPTQGELCIDISRVSLNEKDVRIKIFNNEGKICLDRIIKGQGNLLTIDVSGLSNGVYSFQIVKENKTIITNRFIKE